MFTTVLSRLSLAISFLGLAMFALPSHAATAPGLRLSDNSGDVITIDSTGAVTYSGACTATSCTTTASTGIQATNGQVSWAGTIGDFTFTATGQTAPLRPGLLDINITSLFTGAVGGTLTALFTVNNIDGAPPYTLNQTTLFLAGTGSATFTAFADASNTPYGMATTVATIGPVSGSTASNLIGLPGPDSHDLSATDQVVLTLGPFGFFSTDFYTQNSSNAPLQVSCAPGSDVAGVGYHGSLAASGGVPSFTYSIVGSLPPGLVLNPTTGAISGTPTAQGTFPYTAQVTDSSGSTSSVSVTTGCGITIAPPSTPLGLSCSANTGVIGTPYSSNLVATGGTGLGYMYSIASGSLPPVLTLNPTTGFITGTPTTAGPFSFVAKVTDTGDSTEAPVTNTCTITIPTVPSASCVVINATQGTAIAQATLTGSGGAGGPYTFTATGLPAGLSISSAGVISGTPSVSGTFPYTVTIKDKNGNTGTLNCSVTVTSHITPIVSGDAAKPLASGITRMGRR